MLKRILYLSELILVSLNFFFAYYLLEHYSLNLIKYQRFIQGLEPLPMYLQAFWPAFLVWAVLLWTRNGYSRLRTQTVGFASYHLVIDGFIFLGIFAGLSFFLHLEFLSRFFLIFYTVSTTVLLILTRGIAILIARQMRRHGYSLRNILIVGTGRRAQQFMSLIAKHTEWGLRVVGLLDREAMFVNEDVAGYKVIGTLEDLPDLLEKKLVDEVYFITPRKWLEQISKCIAYCEAVGVPATVSTDLFDVEIASRVPKKLEGMTYLTFETRLLKEGELFAKRFFDIIVSAIALIMSSPILIAVSLASVCTSEGPVFFKQIRSGRYGKRFTLYKFRTMVVDAESKLKELKAQNEMSGPVFKMTHDPRITKLGRFLRKTSLDEFPQFWNVFKGDMSIVGPRPPLPAEVEEYEPWQRRRLSMKPGITCIWQVSGRNSIGFEEWIGLDLRYIDKWSIWLDIKILFRTFHAIFAASGK